MAARRGWIDRNGPALVLWAIIIGAAVLVKHVQRAAAGG